MLRCPQPQPASYLTGIALDCTAGESSLMMMTMRFVIAVTVVVRLMAVVVSRKALAFPI